MLLIVDCDLSFPSTVIYSCALTLPFDFQVTFRPLYLILPTYMLLYICHMSICVRCLFCSPLFFLTPQKKRSQNIMSIDPSRIQLVLPPGGFTTCTVGVSNHRDATILGARGWAVGKVKSVEKTPSTPGPEMGMRISMSSWNVNVKFIGFF